MKKIISLFLIFTICTATGFAVAPEQLNDVVDSTADYLCRTVQYPQFGDVGGEWTVIGLARSGYSVPEHFFDAYYSAVSEYTSEMGGRLHERKYTEYSRLIIALNAIGKDPENVGGYNLLVPLGDYNKTVAQGINGAVFALLAADCGDFEIPINPVAEISASRELYISFILGRQLSNGGFSQFINADAAEPDITGMVLQALAPYRDRADVSTAINRALLCMSRSQTESGGFESIGGETSESCAQMINALCALGISVNDGSFVKNEKTMLDNLLTYRVTDGGFAHALGGDADLMATEQCLSALAALKNSRITEKSTDSQSIYLKLLKMLFMKGASISCHE